MQLGQLRDRFESFVDRGVTLLAVSTDTAESVADARTRQRLPFPLLLDGDGEVAAIYGIRHVDEADRRVVARPSTFVIDAAGVVRFAHVGEHSRDRPTVEATLLALETLRQPDRV